MNFEALGKGGDSAFDIVPRPDSYYTVEMKSLSHIHRANSRVRMCAPHERSMNHVRQAKIGNVFAVACEKPRRFVRFDATSDECG